MARPRRAIRTRWQQVRAPVLVAGVALTVIAGGSIGRVMATDLAAQPAQVYRSPPRTPPVDRSGPRPELTPSAEPTPTPEFTPTPTATPTPSRTPRRTTARPTPTRTATKTTAVAKSTPKPAATTTAASAGNCRALPGLTTRARTLHQTLCSRFPQVEAFHGVRSDPLPDHPSGRAVDIMVDNNTALGNEIAAYLQANASSLGVEYVIWNQRIWSVGRSGEGWRAMADRGSNTANHRDHLHALVK